MARQQLLEAALWYATNGIPVFPLRARSKKPLTEHGFYDATTDDAKIRQFWGRHPNANIGVPTGALSGFLAIDIDPRDGGDASLKRLIVEHGCLPVTAEQITGGGGRHIIFRHINGVRSGILADGIDIKADGGYIVVAPSIHPTGTPYRWDWDDIAGEQALLHPAEIPAWLVHLVTSSRNGTRSDAADNGGKFKPGERHTRLVSLAGSMRRRAMSATAIDVALGEENRLRCDPPLPEKEVREIAASVGKYAPADAAVEVVDWSEPVPFLTSTVPGIAAVVLPGFLGEMVQATALATETPVELPALLGLAVVAASIAKKVLVQPEDGYFEPVNLYTAVGMESGNRKTAVLGRMTKPFVDWEFSESQRLEPELKQITAQRKNGEAQIEGMRRKLAKPGDHKDLFAEIEQLELSLPEIPVLPRLWVQDVTPERLGALMDEHGERMALFSDEGGIFDVLAGRYSKGIPNLDLFLQAHSGAFVAVDRGSRPAIKLYHPALTIGISPQPVVLAGLSDKPGFRGRGLLARFLYGLPPSPLGHRHLTPVPCPGYIEENYRREVQRLLSLSPPCDASGQLSPWWLRFCSPAYEIWKDFQRQIEKQMNEGEKLFYLKDWGSKLPGAAARIAAVFHCVVDDPTENTVIATKMVERAVEFATALIDHALAVFNLMKRDRAVEDAQKILAWIRKERRPSFTVRDCFCAHQSRFEKVDNIRAPLHLLEEHGHIRRAPKENVSHRPSELWEVNPKTLEPLA